MRVAIEGSTWAFSRGFGRFTRGLTRALACLDTAHQLTLVLDSSSVRCTDLPDMPHSVVSTRSRVLRPGFLPDRALAAVYRRATCLVLPSEAEGFGLPVLEAMASGTPVVASRIPALEEVCEDAAEYFGDLEALPGALTRVLEDPDRRSALARRGLERSAAFGWGEAARRLLAALSGP